MSKRTTITITPEIYELAKQLKQHYFEKSFSEIYRMIMRAGVQHFKDQKIDGATR